MRPRYGLQTVRRTRIPDAAGRTEVSWDVIWLRLPDDGTGALPLLRHIVFNDQKSSTYKLALLRTLVRIADGAGGFARPGADERHVDLPLGLVALFWIRAFKPLLASGFPQLPTGNGRLRFVKDGFRALDARSPNDFRVGRQFTGEDAANMVRALRDAAHCIRWMPATYTTYPGSADPVFPCKPGKPVRTSQAARLDDAFLWSFGTFSVPTHLWQAMSRYASWDEHLTALRWLKPEHDTGIVRALGRRLRRSGSALFCVWSGRRLRDEFDVDHCFPFAAWPCNDLWNLLPSSTTVNRSKGDRLPAPEALERAKPLMLDWWDRAYLRDASLATRFEDEVRSALPAVATDTDKLTPESLFEGIMIQQIVLKRDQQLAEWVPGS